MSPEREKAIKKHLDKQIKDFKKKVFDLAMKNDYPYIESHLNSLIIEINQSIAWNSANICESERKFSFLA